LFDQMLGRRKQRAEADAQEQKGFHVDESTGKEGF
jgi:hypothetical protein